MRYLRIVFLCLPHCLFAEKFPLPFNSEKETSTPLLTAQEAAESFQIPEGFQTTVFASEPEVQNPISMTWDHLGRMWVAENYTYAERSKRFELSLRDRIIILQDTDHDGQADRRKVFTDQLQMLTSVEMGQGGIWAMCPPQLLFIADKNGDDLPDTQPEVVLDGFTVAQNNYHNFANGLRFGPDGWLYGRCGGSCPGMVGLPGSPEDQRVPLEGGIWRFHPLRKTFEVLCHGTTNPWGHDWDQHGELFFINTVNGHLWHLIAGAHFERPFNPSPNQHIYEPIEMHADHYHYDRSGSWTKSRDGRANGYGGGHAHIGMCIYQGGHLPSSWQGKLLTWNQHGRRLNVERLESTGSGYIGKHEPDVLLSGDLWFRGLEIQTGPEGALYALDWSDTGECHDHTGVHRTSGRIYRFSQGTPPEPQLQLLSSETLPDFLKTLNHTNVWFPRKQRQQIEKTKTHLQASKELHRIAQSNQPTSLRLRALELLRDIEKIDPYAFLGDSDEFIRIWALRALTDHLPLDHVYGLHPQHNSISNPALQNHLLRLATSDPSAKVRLALASIIQRLPLQDRPSLAAALASRQEDGQDHNLPKLVWFGLTPLLKDSPDELLQVARATRWPKLLGYLARSMVASPDPIIDLAIQHPTKAPHLLQGLCEGFQGWQKAPAPKNWKYAVEQLTQSNPDHVRNLSALFGDGRAMESIKAIAFDSKADPLERSAALQSIIDARPQELRQICEELLSTRYVNKTAIRGLAIFDDASIATTLLKKYSSFRPDERIIAIDTLVSRPNWAMTLLKEVDSKRIPRQEISAYHARQIEAFEEDALTTQLHQSWGQIHPPNRQKTEKISEIRRMLTPELRAQADLSNGRLLFNQLCASCHRLYGQGGELGPDLTGSGRTDLGYLLENIIDPGANVSVQYQLQLLKLADGRTLTGVIASQSDRTLNLRSLTEEVTLEKTSILKIERLPTSIMPEALMDNLSEAQIRDLLSYLMSPQQVPLKK